MRIALVIPKFDAGGAERVMSIMVDHLSRNHKVHLVFHVLHQPFYPIPDGVPIHYVDTVRLHTSFFAKLFAYLGGLFRLRRLLKRIRPDVIVSFYEYRFDQVVILAKMFLRIPVVVSDRNDPSRYHGIRRLIRNIIYRFADAIVVQTSYARNYYERHLRHKRIALIHNPVSVVPLHECPKEPLILNVGRLVPQKGQAYLIEAFAHLNRNGWRLAILGDGPLAQELKDLAGQMGVGDQVAFPGVVKDIGFYLQRASIFVLPSLREGFPNALAEAMAAGIACIAFNCNEGLSELIQDGSNGFLVEPRDLMGLTERIACLAGDVQLRQTLGREASKVGTRFCQGSVIRKWNELLESVSRAECG